MVCFTLLASQVIFSLTTKLTLPCGLHESIFYLSIPSSLATRSLVTIFKPVTFTCLALIIYLTSLRALFLRAHPIFVRELSYNSAKWKTKINEATWIQKLRIKLQTLFIDLSTTVMQITVAQECNMCCLQYDSGNTNCTEQQPSSTSHYAYKQTYCTDKTLIHF